MQKKIILSFAFLLIGIVNIVAQSSASFSFFEYKGKDQFFDRKINQKNEYRNPILSGFYPDPSICRKGEDYYMVNSSFSFYPGIPIFTSKNLVNWKQIGNVLDRPSQLNLDSIRISGGIYAPTIRYNKFNDTFYLITTCVDGIGNFIVKTKDPYIGWSEPVLLPEVGGIDPSLFFDDNGKAYIVNNDAPIGTPKWEGHRAIWIHEFDTITDKTVGIAKIIVDGGADISKKPVWIEGPHLFKKNGKYVLIAAEGGTGTNHSQVAFLSGSIFGPYIPYSNNPILSQRDMPENRTNKITSVGHADLTDDKQGNTWAVFLGCRPYEKNYYNTGRETFLLPITWKNDIPIILSKGKAVPTTMKKKNSGKDSVALTGNFIWRDKFESSTLNSSWLMIRTPHSNWYDLRNNKLILKAIPINIYDISQPAFLGHRQQNSTFEATTELNFLPKSSQEIAGIVCFQNEKYNIVFGKTKIKENDAIVLDWSADGIKRIATYLIPQEFRNSTVQLKIEGEGEYYNFYAKFPNGNWISVAKKVDARNLSSENAGGFTGNIIGLYASSEVKPKILKKVYSNYFPIGVAVSGNHLIGKNKDLLLKHFSSLTAENAMKPENLMRKDGTYNWSNADNIVKFAHENKLLVRGHTLVWHNQTPDWFFKNEKGMYVDSTIMYKRLEKYMTDVMTHFKKDVYCWDVVNEAISDGASETYRTDSPWYKTCGTGYIEKAFRLAHKIDPNVKLYYNDYNLVNPEKRMKVYNMLRNLIKKGVPIYGIGLQGHWSTQDLDPEEIQKTIDLFSSLGLDIQITELDMTVYGTYHGAGAKIQSRETHLFNPYLEKMQADKYKQVFEILRKNKEKISGVTFWGLADNYTWLDSFPVSGRKDFPLLFNQQFQPKMAFYAITDF
jgi:beta-xylosidase